MRSAVDAVAFATRYTTCAVGLCLWYVQHWLGAAHTSPDAYHAWRVSKTPHPGDYLPPRGVPVYFQGGSRGFGHVALSLGGGRVWSTDWPRAGVCGAASIRDIEKKWGMKYLGWAGDSGGVPINYAVPVQPIVYLNDLNAAVRADRPATGRHTGKFKSQVLTVENALRSEGLLGASYTDGSAGARTFGPGSGYAAWQRRCGFTGTGADGWLPTRVTGKDSLSRLGAKHGFKVVQSR